MLKNPVRSFEKACEEAQLDGSNDEYNKGTCNLLRAKAKEQMQSALESWTSGAPLPFALPDVKATISELNTKIRTASCHARAMHAVCAMAGPHLNLRDQRKHRLGGGASRACNPQGWPRICVNSEALIGIFS